MTDYDGGKYPKHYNSHELKDDGIVAANMDEILQIADKMNAPMFVQPPEMKRWMPYTIYNIGEVILDFFNRMQRCSQYVGCRVAVSMVCQVSTSLCGITTMAYSPMTVVLFGWIWELRSHPNSQS